MAARRYEIFLRVKYCFQHQKKNFVSPSGHVMFYLLYKHQQTTNGIPNHFTLIVFWCERCDLLCSHSKGDIFTCEDNLLFSHVKISSFRAKAHLVFHWCLSNNIYLMDNKDRGKASSSTHTIEQKRERRELRWTNNYNCNNRPLQPQVAQARNMSIGEHGSCCVTFRI